MTGAQATVTSAERSFAIAGDVTNSVIVTGDNNTVQVRVDGNEALLADLLTGSRVPRKSLRPLPLDGVPAPSPDHIDRTAEAQAVRAGLGVGRAFEIGGVREIGKSFVARHALAGAADMPDGTDYVFAKDSPYADVLQELHEAFYECEPPALAGPQQIRIDVASRRALVVLDAVALERDELRQLTLMLPRCEVVLVARGRVGLGEGGRLVVGGLAVDDAIALVEQELGRPLQAIERPAVEQLATLLGGHPFQLRQTAADVRDGRHSFAELAQTLATNAGGGGDAALADLLLASLTGQDVAVVEQLAALRGATVGVEHIAALAGAADVMPALRALEARRLIASGSPRYRVAGALHELPVPSRTAVQHASDYFSRWARTHRGRPATVLAEAPALLELIARAAAEGRDADVIELGRASDAAFAWGRRWQTWGIVLETVLAAARRTHDRSALAWALHQLGTRAYCLGDGAAAITALEDALHIREQLGEAGGVAATRHNLDFIRNPPAGGDNGGGGNGSPRWPGGYSPVLLALLVALVAGVGAAVAVAVSNGGPSPAEPFVLPDGSPTSTHAHTHRQGASGVPTVRTHTDGGRTGTDPVRTSPVAGPEIDATPDPLDFADVVVNTPDKAAVSITNTGKQALHVTSVGLSDDTDFHLPPDAACGSVASGTTCKISVRFIPTTEGEREASLIIESDAPDSPLTVALSGVGAPPPAPVFHAADVLRFGTQLVHSTTQKRVTVRNDGDAGALLTFTDDPTLLPDPGASYAIVPGGKCDAGASLDAGEECFVTIAFTPRTPGEKDATLTFADNAGGPHTVRLTGMGQSLTFQGPR
jgi:hypothetical protein